MIKNIVFDMGQVLIPFSPMEYMERYVPDREDRALLFTEVFQSAEWIQGDRGIVTPQEQATSICKRIPGRLHETVSLLFATWPEQLRPAFADMEILAGELKAAGYKIYLLSNTSRAYYEFRKHIPALRFFDGEFVSCDHRVLKPDIEIYRLFCKEFDLLPQECFFIDDSPINIEGAIWFGMSGFIYRRNTDALRAALKEAGVAF